MPTTKRQKQAKHLRQARKWHRTTGIFLFLFFVIMGSTGILLGWKKNSGGYLLPQTQKGNSNDLATWLPLEELVAKANQAIQDSLGEGYDTTIARLDIRPQKGVLKVLYKAHYCSIQLDGSTGAVLQIAKRRSDFLENVHDGSIVDQYLGIPNGSFKLFYTTIMGTALLIFSSTGFWLWYGPKRMRKKN